MHCLNGPVRRLQMERKGISFLENIKILGAGGQRTTSSTSLHLPFRHFHFYNLIM